jgi:predicted dehydrogenase
MTLFLDAYLREDKSFVDAILNDREPSVTGYDGMMAVSIVEAGNRSILDGAVIEL